MLVEADVPEAVDIMYPDQAADIRWEESVIPQDRDPAAVIAADPPPEVLTLRIIPDRREEYREVR